MISTRLKGMASWTPFWQISPERTLFKMIRYALHCIASHEFEAWFSNSDAFDSQKESGLISCPVCGSTEVSKQIMAPAVAGTRKQNKTEDRVPATAGGGAPSTEDVAKMVAKVREHIAETHDFVGTRFADEARAMHYGEKEHRPVWGETTPQEAKSLVEEGVQTTPLPEPFAPPKPIDASKIN